MSDQDKPTVLVLASTYPRWANDPEPGFVHQLCQRLTDRFTVIAVVPDAPGADPNGIFEGVQVVRYRYAPRRLQTLVNNGGIAANLKLYRWKWLLLPGFVLGQLIAARQVFRRQRVDVVHAHWLIPQGLVARRLRRPYLVTSHGGDLFGLRGGLLTRLKRKVAGSAAAMTVVSRAMQEEALRQCIHAPALSVVPMGVDLQERFTPGSDLRSADELLFVGRLVAKKGLRFLLQAMPMIIARRPSVRLTIAGFGPQEAALRRQVDELGIGAHVTFKGAVAQDQLPALYRRAAVFVAPFVRDSSGDQEGLPVALMEAVGCGCPVVAGQVQGLGDLLGESAATVCVDPTNPTALADAVLDNLEHPERAQARAQAIRTNAMARVDWQAVAGRYGDLLMQCAQPMRKD
ncbi:glycosyltransferase [Frateuria hangzhouensis]|uniref:glycosyltransferase n=1 Tax=Frateuria hangzhouensis TaxID=2995589 RepID=UPI00226081A4|nr:glycosyltransferase [Frateuria sp. STR12]MCX7513744.1 glycosyltransferase [Frateuria sp. STR12]